MRLATIHKDDLIQCEVKGRTFEAKVVEKAGRMVRIEPLSPQITNRFVRSHQVKRRGLSAHGDRGGMPGVRR